MWYIFDVGSLGGPASAVAAEPGVDNVEEVCARHPMGKPKIDNYTKLKAKLRDYGLKQAADALHALMYDRSYSLPSFPWLSLAAGWWIELTGAILAITFSSTSQPPHGDSLLESLGRRGVVEVSRC